MSIWYNIKTASDKFGVERLLAVHPHVDQWTVDQQGEDCVLRVISPRLTHGHVINMVKGRGYHCEELKD